MVSKIKEKEVEAPKILSAEEELKEAQKQAQEWAELSDKSLIKAEEALKSAKEKVEKCSRRLDEANAKLAEVCPPMTESERYRQFLKSEKIANKESVEHARLMLIVEASKPGSPLDKALEKRPRQVVPVQRSIGIK